MTGLPTPGRLVRVGGAVVLVVAVLVVGVTAVPELAGADRSYVVTSGSMEPAIGVDDVVLVRSVEPSSVERGDVITFGRAGGARTTHRVVEVVEREDGRYFRTKGDANEDADPRLVAPPDVVGEAVLTIPHVGSLVRFANTGPGAIVLVVVPAVLLAATELWHLASKLRVGGDGAEPTGDD